MPAVASVLSPVATVNLLPRSWQIWADKIFGMFAFKAKPCGDGSGDVWAEVSYRYAARGLGCSTTTIFRVLSRISRMLGFKEIAPQDVERDLGFRLRDYRMCSAAWGTFWRIPSSVWTWISSTFSGTWSPPAADDWLPVEGLDQSKPHGTCYCPNQLCEASRPRAAYIAHPDGTWHITCQVCKDGDERQLSFFAKRDQSGAVIACYTRRSKEAGGLNGEGGSLADLRLPDEPSPPLGSALTEALAAGLVRAREDLCSISENVLTNVINTVRTRLFMEAGSGSREDLRSIHLPTQKPASELAFVALTAPADPELVIESPVEEEEIEPYDDPWETVWAQPPPENGAG